MILIQNSIFLIVRRSVCTDPAPINIIKFKQFSRCNISKKCKIMLIENFNSCTLFSFIVQLLNPGSVLTTQNSQKRVEQDT